jgi:hypothetical protein
MATTIQQIPVRLQFSTASAPPIAPIDYNTGLAPAVWRAQSAAIAAGIFDPAGAPVDMSNITYLQLILQEAPDSLQSLVVKQVDAADIDEITVGGWRAGLEQNALFQFTPADLDQNLLAGRSREFWIVLVGMTDEGAPIIFGAGPLTIYLASNALPVTPPKYVALAINTTTVGDFTVTPTAQIFTEVVTVVGAARTVNAILGINGIVDGAKLTLVLILPETADITINVRSGIVTNPVISTVSTGSVLSALLEYHFDAGAAAWVPDFYLLPPTS